VQMELVGDPYYSETLVPSGQSVYLIYTPDTTQDYSVAWDNYIMNQNTWTKVPFSPGHYKFTNTGSSDMTLVIKIFKVEIKSI